MIRITLLIGVYKAFQIEPVGLTKAGRIVGGSLQNFVETKNIAFELFSYYN
jgi:hypothetical protein